MFILEINDINFFTTNFLLALFTSMITVDREIFNSKPGAWKVEDFLHWTDICSDKDYSDYNYYLTM